MVYVKIGELIKDCGYTWKVVSCNDLGIPYFVKVKNGIEEKTQYSIDGYEIKK